jgi:hypothetical protein
MESFEIWYKDLNPEAQKRYLEYNKVEDPEDLNPDLAPLAIIEHDISLDIGNDLLPILQKIK